jgi:hypothetical protein
MQNEILFNHKVGGTLSYKDIMCRNEVLTVSEISLAQKYRDQKISLICGIYKNDLMAMMVNGGYQSPGKIRNREEWETKFLD